MRPHSNADPFDRPALRAGREGEPILARRAHGALESALSTSRNPWLARLRHALDEDLFVLHVQPILSLRENAVTHHEVLLRLADGPHGTLVTPDRFLPAAERHGLIGEIDRMVLGKSVGLLAGVQRAHGLEQRIAVNVSALSITDGALLTDLDRALTRHGADPCGLILEVTETAAISDMEAAASFCAQAQALGCAIALDDFGAGFGSFQYLKRLPFTYLKIDGEFIRALPSSRIDQLLVKALVGVVAGIGRLTVAEFVGDETTVRMLHSYGVDFAQGYAIGRPAAIPPAYA